MKFVAAFLLAAVFLRHGSIYWLADVTGFTPSAMSYVLGGIEEVMLGGVLSFLLWMYPASLWRNLAIGAAAIAMLEGAQIAGCRVAITNIADVPFKVSLCDYLFGVPIGAVMVTLYMLIVCYAIGSALKR